MQLSPALGLKYAWLSMLIKNTMDLASVEHASLHVILNFHHAGAPKLTLSLDLPVPMMDGTAPTPRREPELDFANLMVTDNERIDVEVYADRVLVFKGTSQAAWINGQLSSSDAYASHAHEIELKPVGTADEPQITAAGVKAKYFFGPTASAPLRHVLDFSEELLSRLQPALRTVRLQTRDAAFVGHLHPRTDWKPAAP